DPALEGGVGGRKIALELFIVPVELPPQRRKLREQRVCLRANLVLRLLQRGLLPDHRVDRVGRVLAREAAGFDAVRALRQGARPPKDPGTLPGDRVDLLPQLRPEGAAPRLL